MFSDKEYLLELKKLISEYEETQEKLNNLRNSLLGYPVEILEACGISVDELTGEYDYEEDDYDIEF